MPMSIFRDEVQRLLRDEAAQLVEVLPPSEFEDEHIEGAINIPLRDSQLFVCIDMVELTTLTCPHERYQLLS